jgi:hypothetical protein
MTTGYFGGLMVGFDPSESEFQIIGWLGFVTGIVLALGLAERDHRRENRHRRLH